MYPKAHFVEITKGVAGERWPGQVTMNPRVTAGLLFLWGWGEGDCLTRRVKRVRSQESIGLATIGFNGLTIDS